MVEFCRASFKVFGIFQKVQPFVEGATELMRLIFTDAEFGQLDEYQFKVISKNRARGIAQHEAVAEIG